jgi:hypothetical protein
MFFSSGKKVGKKTLYKYKYFFFPHAVTGESSRALSKHDDSFPCPMTKKEFSPTGRNVK